MKLELGAHKIVGFCALKAKCYAILIEPDPPQLKYETDNKIKHPFKLINTENGQLGIVLRCKGINKSARDTLSFLSYYYTLKNEQVVLRDIFKMASKNHVIHQLTQRKVALTPFDDKRYLKNCGIHTLAYASIYIDPYSKCNCGGLG